MENPFKLNWRHLTAVLVVNRVEQRQPKNGWEQAEYRMTMNIYTY